MENQQQPTPNAQPQNYNQEGYYPQQNSVVSVDWMLIMIILYIIIFAVVGGALLSNFL